MNDTRDKQIEEAAEEYGRPLGEYYSRCGNHIYTNAADFTQGASWAFSQSDEQVKRLEQRIVKLRDTIGMLVQSTPRVSEEIMGIKQYVVYTGEEALKADDEMAGK